MRNMIINSVVFCLLCGWLCAHDEIRTKGKLSDPEDQCYQIARDNAARLFLAELVKAEFSNPIMQKVAVASTANVKTVERPSCWHTFLSYFLVQK